MLRDLGWLKRIFVKDSGGTVINPSTKEKQGEIKNVLSQIENNTDTLEEKIGGASGTNLLTELQNIWDKLVSLFDNGLAKFKIWDGEDVAQISPSGRLLIDSSPPAPPSDTMAVDITVFGDVSGTHDTDYLIPNGENLNIQRFSAGAQPAGGSDIELWYDPDGTKNNMEIIDVIFSDGHSDQHDLNCQKIGDGIKRIIMRRTGLGSSNARIVFGRWEGYY